MVYSHPNKLLSHHIQEIKEIININPDEQLHRIIEYHDIGKCTSIFQQRLNENNKRDNKYDRHAKLSAILFWYTFQHELDNIDTIKAMNVIAGHHGKLSDIQTLKNYMIHGFFDSPDDLLYVLDNYIQGYEELADNIRETLHDEFDNYLRQQAKRLFKRVKFSLNDFMEMQSNLAHLGCADMMSAAIGHNKERLQIDRKYVDIFLHSLKDVKQSYNNKNKLNTIRDSIEIDMPTESGVYSLTLPTGMGKTLQSLKIAENTGRRTIIATAFLTLVEQFQDVIRNVYEELEECKIGGEFLNIHTSNVLDGIYEEDNIHRELLRNTWNGNIVLTSTVQLIETLISTKVGKIRKLSNMQDSIVIIDEPQTIPQKYWYGLKDLLEYYAHTYNVIFVLVSATPPKLPDSCKELVNDVHSVFQQLNRTSLQLVDIDIGERTFAQTYMEKALELCKGDVQLWFVNTKKKANELYEYLLDEGYDTLLMTADLCLLERKCIIDLIKSKMAQGDKFIIVSTQVLECGFDVDCHNVIREIAPLPVIIQAAGRLNRKWHRDMETCYIFDFGENQVYSDTEFSITRKLIHTYKGYIPEKEYLNASDTYYQMIDNATLDSINFKELMERCCDELNEIKLIENNNKNLATIIKKEYTVNKEFVLEKFKEMTGIEIVDVQQLIDLFNFHFSNKDYKNAKVIKSYINLFTVTGNKLGLDKLDGLDYYVDQNFIETFPSLTLQLNVKL